ncbi:MAG: hypothetical protein KAW56_14245 [Candidatus Marinimicrobia bacterium]|nr:hypothetical protein [candidate division WOR-3 bacterium]MCK4448228.1 hypothetical protein [Candidatus Neomarinimicrobiota bacterium]
MLSRIWNYQIQIIPVIIALLVYELPAFIRRLKRLYYVPVYFSIFPLRAINSKLASYLGEGLAALHDLSEAEREKLRSEIIRVSIISMLLDAYLIPLIMGVIFSLFLKIEIFYQFLFIFIIVKIITITLSLKNFHLYSSDNIGTRKNHILLVVVYICYLGIIYEVLKKSYFWAFSYISEGNYLGMLIRIKEIIFTRAIPEIVIFGLIVYLFIKSITDKKFLYKNEEEF